MSAAPKPLVVKDAEHLAFLRTLPCVFAEWGNCDYAFSLTGRRQSEVSHWDGKSRDDRAASCCPGHHRTNVVSWHSGQETFCRTYDTSKEELIAAAEQLYRERHP